MFFPLITLLIQNIGAISAGIAKMKGDEKKAAQVGHLTTMLNTSVGAVEEYIKKNPGEAGITVEQFRASLKAASDAWLSAGDEAQARLDRPDRQE